MRVHEYPIGLDHHSNWAGRWTDGLRSGKIFIGIVLIPQDTSSFKKDCCLCCVIISSHFTESGWSLKGLVTLVMFWMLTSVLFSRWDEVCGSGWGGLLAAPPHPGAGDVPRLHTPQAVRLAAGHATCATRGIPQACLECWRPIFKYLCEGEKAEHDVEVTLLCSYHAWALIWLQLPHIDWTTLLGAEGESHKMIKIF